MDSTRPAPENHQEFAKEYLSSLVDLTYNSKPLIDMLTILAEENIEHGQVIVNAVEHHISKVVPEYKLPVLYLIDSIVKNVGREYTDLFSHSIVNIFYGVFKKVNEKVRAKMFSLRQTWNDVFTQPKLYALDLKVNGVDPAWPITAKVAPAIHVNPNFLKSQQEKERQAKLIEKQLALIELENRRLELEMAKKLAEKQAIIEPRFSPEPEDPPSPIAMHQHPPPPMQIANVNPNKTRVAPVNPLMIARMRDPRVARAMQQQQQQMQLNQQHVQQQQQQQLEMLAMQQQQQKSAYAANSDMSKRIPLTRPVVAPVVPAVEPEKSSEQHAQILAELETGVKDIREQKQRIAHKSPAERTRTNSTSKSTTVSSTSSLSRTKSTARNASKSSSSASSKSSSSSRERSERRSDSKSSGRRSSSEGHSDRKKPRPNSLSSPKSDQKSPKQSSAADSRAATSSDSSPPKPVRPKSSLAQKYSSYLQRNRSDNNAPSSVDADAKCVVSTTFAASDSTVDEKSCDLFDASKYRENSNELKKRESEERTMPEEPLSKKTKSEKIDLLFGSEDVDLRTLINPMHAQMAKLSTPPPSQTRTDMSLVKNESPSKLDEVRAKLAEASKAANNNNTERQRTTSENQDVDLRSPILTNNPILSDESSQDTKYNMIVSQAHHQLDSEQISLEQYNNLIKQVMQVKTQQKRESLKRKNDSTSPIKSPIVVLPPTSEEDGTEVSSTSGSGTESESTGTQRIRKRDRQLSEDSTSDGVEKKRTRDRPRKTKWSAPTSHPHPTTTMPHSTNMPPVVLPPSVPVSVPPPSFPVINPMAMPPLTTQMPPNMWPMNQAPPNIPFNPIVPPMWSQPPQMPIMPMMMGNPAVMPIPIMPPPSMEPGGSRSIAIDGIQREIRFYGEIAIAFMGDAGNEPREIGFQAGERRIFVDNKDAIRLAFNDSYTPFTIDGITYQIRFGTPIRELYINNQWFECLFGDQSLIPLAGKPRVFQVEGPSPQVRIGLVRKDLVAGKVDLYIDSTIKRPFFLDSLVQHFELDGQMHTLQFADYFLSVLIDGEIFSVQYGSMPKRFRIGGRDRFIRFSVLPNNMVAGSVYVRNMIRTDRHRNTASPVPQAMLPEIAAAAPIIPSVAAAPVPVVPDVPSLNIDDLLQKLVAAGIFNNKKSEEAEVKAKPKPTPIDLSKPETLKQRQEAHIDGLFTGMQCSSCGVRFPPEQTTKYSQHLDWHFRQNRRDRDSARKAHSRRWYYDVADWVQYEEIEDLDDREKNWFETQQIEGDAIMGGAGVTGIGTDDAASRNDLLEMLPSCVAGPEDVDKTCDMCHDQFETFYNEETEDWHLRNAVRGEEGATYHPICYEDYKNSLTLDRTAINADLESALKKEEASEDVNIILDDEDDDVIVLPTEEPVVTEIPDEDELKNHALDDEDESKAITPEPNVDASSAITSTPAPVSTLPQPVMNYEPVGNESDLQILVPQISVLDLDEYEDKPVAENDGDSNQSEVQLPIKIKEEPRKGYNDEEEDEDDGFEEVGTIEGAAIIDDDSVDILLNNAIAAASSAPSTVVATPQPSQSDMTSLDGNVQPQDALPAGLPTTNRIKINITKNVSNKIVINTSENTDKTQSNSESNSCDSMARSTVQPGTDSTTPMPETSDNPTASCESMSHTGDAIAPQAPLTPEPEPEIDYDIKESMRDVSFQRMTLVKNGLETSGLCSIM